MKVEMNGKNVTVPDAEIKRLMTTLDLPEDEAIELFLADEGLMENEEVVEMTAKAKAAGVGAKATGERKERKPPVRKPDLVKRELIEAIFMTLVHDAKFDNVKNESIINIERMIAFEIGNEKFELTLTKKRPAKK